MLNKDKIRLMTQLTLYEEREGRRDISLSKFYPGDYARFNVLKTAIAFTIAYVLILLLITLCNLDYLMDNALTVDFRALGMMSLGVYIGGMAVYLMLSLVGYSLYYKYSRRKLGRYYKLLRALKKSGTEGE